MDKLKNYNSKRDFNKTKEPRGKGSHSGKKLKFVVQHHAAKKDHYDLRLEWKGVYISFAVPKGPSFDPKDKRLAVKVEDHPVSYGTFEGTIPKGEYGGGTVMLWDRGYWEPYKDHKVDFEKGPVKFILKGKRLNGCWTLVPFKEDNWLLIKEKDEYAKRFDIKRYKTSIKTKRTMEEIAKNVTPLKDIEISNPEKIIYPKDKITKGDIVEYYKDISKRMLPLIENRLISTVRTPAGIDGERFFMKHLNTDSKDLGKKMIADEDGVKKDYYYIKNVNGLISEVQMNSYEFHIWGSHKDKLNHPDMIVFDLDPDEELSLKRVRDGVKDLKSILDELKLKSFLKTSGGKGYHVVVPIELPSFKKCESIAKTVAELMTTRWPDKYTTNMRKEKRKGKIFIDYFRNQKGATSVAPYSLRVRDGAPISFPISWSKLDEIKPNEITIKNYKKYLNGRDPYRF